jgi:hypothetical protein
MLKFKDFTITYFNKFLRLGAKRLIFFVFSIRCNAPNVVTTVLHIAFSWIVLKIIPRDFAKFLVETFVKLTIPEKFQLKPIP